MRIFFDVIDMTGATVSEGDTDAAMAEGRIPSGEPYLFGTLHLEADGEPPIALYDDLQFLIPGLCLRATSALADAGSAEVRIVSGPERVRLARDGAAVRVEADDGDGDIVTARFPEAELVAGLKDCARRFAAFVTRLGAVESDWVRLGEALSAQVA